MADAYDTLINAAFKRGGLSAEEKAAITELYHSDGRESVHTAVLKRKILPFAAALLSKLELDKPYWEDITETYRKRNENIIRQLDVVFEEFRKRGVKKAFVTENFGAFLSAEADRALFASGDVDIYADTAEGEMIYGSFEQLGYRAEENFAARKLISTAFYNGDIFGAGFHFVVAWEPLSRIKLPCLVDADDIVDWNSLREVRDTAIMLPDAEVLMYLCLLHISLHSFSRAPDIRLYADIVNAAGPHVDWERIIGFAKREHTMVRMLTSCILSKKIVDADIPETVLGAAAQYDRQISRILRSVYDKEGNTLRCEPKGIRILRIEAACDDQGILHGLMKILFPERNWVKVIYADIGESIITAYCRHIKSLLLRGDSA